MLQDYIPTNSGMADGDITLDEMFLQWYRLDKFDLALGRMQTKFVARRSTSTTAAHVLATSSLSKTWNASLFSSNDAGLNHAKLPQLMSAAIRSFDNQS